MKPEDIKRETILYGILGDALEKRNLPSNINDYFDDNQMDSFCSIFNIRAEDLGFFLHGLRQQHNVKGLFVEPSHSSDALEKVDELSIIAKVCGVIDSIEIRDGKLIGTMSFVEGVAKTLYAKGILQDKKVAVIGTNSYAKAMILALSAFNPKEILLVDPFLEEALQLSSEITAINAYKSFDFARCASDIKCDMSEVTVLINMSDSGIENQDNFINFNHLSDEIVIVDHHTLEEADTYLIDYANKNGLSMMDGLYLKLLGVSENIYYWQEKNSKIADDYRTIKTLQKV
jgi:shikimate 5-dehydrogenase